MNCVNWVFLGMILQVCQLWIFYICITATVFKRSTLKDQLTKEYLSTGPVLES